MWKIQITTLCFILGTISAVLLNDFDETAVERNSINSHPRTYSNEALTGRVQTIADGEVVLALFEYGQSSPTSMARFVVDENTSYNQVTRSTDGGVIMGEYHFETDATLPAVGDVYFAVFSREHEGPLYVDYLKRIAYE